MAQTDLGLLTYGCSGVNVDPGNATRPTNGINVPAGLASSNLLFNATSQGVCVSPAANAAGQFATGSADDWYIPSTDELITLREQGRLTSNTPGTAYWSSTEDSAQNAFTVLVRDTNNDDDQGEPSTTSKSTQALVLPIRSF